MKSAAKWIIPLVRPDMTLVWTNLLWVSIVAGLSYWSDVWLPTEVTDWLGHQNSFTKFAVYCAVYCAGGFVIYIVALIVVAKIMTPIDFAFNPAYEAERAQRRQVQKFKMGDRVRVVDRKGEDRGTITRVDATGEYFYVTWDDGLKTTHSHFAVEDIEPCT
jgi:hypothetical protein